MNCFEFNSKLWDTLNYFTKPNFNCDKSYKYVGGELVLTRDSSLTEFHLEGGLFYKCFPEKHTATAFVDKGYSNLDVIADSFEFIDENSLSNEKLPKELVLGQYTVTEVIMYGWTEKHIINIPKTVEKIKLSISPFIEDVLSTDLSRIKFNVDKENKIFESTSEGHLIEKESKSLLYFSIDSDFFYKKDPVDYIIEKGVEIISCTAFNNETYYNYDKYVSFIRNLYIPSSIRKIDVLPQVEGYIFLDQQVEKLSSFLEANSSLFDKVKDGQIKIKPTLVAPKVNNGMITLNAIVEGKRLYNSGNEVRRPLCAETVPISIDTKFIAATIETRKFSCAPITIDHFYYGDLFDPNNCFSEPHTGCSIFLLPQDPQNAIKPDDVYEKRFWGHIPVYETKDEVDRLIEQAKR